VSPREMIDVPAADEFVALFLDSESVVHVQYKSLQHPAAIHRLSFPAAAAPKLAGLLLKLNELGGSDESAADDLWVKKQGIDFRFLHALGAINFVWNACEHGLLPLFCIASNTSLDRAQLIVHDLGDTTICDKIRSLLTLHPEYSGQEKQMIFSALDAYDINRLNRNQLSHFSPNLEESEIKLFRRKGPELMKDAFPSDLATIRRVADDIARLTGYFGVLSKYFLAKAKGREPGPLPGIIHAPERLWKPPQQDRKTPRRPPPPSRA